MTQRRNHVPRTRVYAALLNLPSASLFQWGSSLAPIPVAHRTDQLLRQGRLHPLGRQRQLADAPAGRGCERVGDGGRRRPLRGLAGTEADWAEADSADALDFADWAVENAQLSMLNALNARAVADRLAKADNS